VSSQHRLSLAIALALATSASVAAAQSPPVPSGAGEPVQLEAVIVRPQLEQQQRAIEEKRGNDAITDTVASDTMGQYPDNNVGESLQRLPGISVTRDQGEGRYVVVRGLDAAQNTVTVDGIAMGTPEDGSRAAPLDVIPSDSTEQLTVIKAPTPDLPGDSLGGTIQVQTASAFDRDGRQLRASAEASHQTLSSETSPKAAFNYSEVFDERLGVSFGLSWQDRDYESDNIEVEYDEVDGIDGRLAPIEVQQRKYVINRERTGLNLNLEWRPDDDSRYSLRTLYTDFTDAESRQRSIIPVGEGDVTNVDGNRYTVEGIDPGDFSRRIRWRTKAEDTFTAGFSGENRFERSKLEYGLGWTAVRERVDDEVEARFSYEGSDDIAIDVATGGVPAFTVIDPSGDGWLRNENYSFNRLVLAPKQVDDEAMSARMDFTLDGDRVSWKAGLLGRWRDRDVNVDEAELRVGPDFLLSLLNGDSNRYSLGDMGDGISPGALREYLRQNLALYSARPGDVAENTLISRVEDYVASEDVLSGYLMATLDFDRLRVIAGARVEQTRFDATGNAAEFDEDGVLTVSPSSADSRYTDILPGLHLRYDTANDWVLRGALTRTIARPQFGDISPRAQINREDAEADLGNPALDPYTSDNFDLSFERYLGDSGLVSVGVFHKSIDGYIVETWTDNDPRYPGFEVTQPVNGEDASVTGIELNWQQKFDSGLLLGLSGTWLDTEFTAGTEDRAGENFSLPRSSDTLWSAHVGWENDRVSLRLAAVHRSEYLDEIGDSADYDLYVARNTQLDFSADWKVGGGLDLYLKASNLLDEPLELYQGQPSNTLQLETYGRTIVAGAKYRF
jgi:TonB-dependent receptor